MHDRLITRCNKTHVTTPPNRSSVSYSIFVNEIWVTQTEEGRHNDTPTPSLSFPAAPQLFESDEFAAEFFRRPLKNNRRKSPLRIACSSSERSNTTDRLRTIAADSRDGFVGTDHHRRTTVCSMRAVFWRKILENFMRSSSFGEQRTEPSRKHSSKQLFRRG